MISSVVSLLEGRTLRRRAITPSPRMSFRPRRPLLVMRTGEVLPPAVRLARLSSNVP